jgi:hypothetical protein
MNLGLSLAERILDQFREISNKKAVRAGFTT